MDAIKLENHTEKLSLSVEEEDGFTVNPWEVTSTSEKGVDYDKLISKKCFVYPICNISRYLSPCQIN